MKTVQHSKININKKGEVVIKFGGTPIGYTDKYMPITTYKFTRMTSNENIKYIGIGIEEDIEGTKYYSEIYEVTFQNGHKNRFSLNCILFDLDENNIPTKELRITKNI